MTITTTKTICDVTGKEVPTLRAQIGPSHQYDLSHHGAVTLIQEAAFTGEPIWVALQRMIEDRNGSTQPTKRALSQEQVRKQAARECIEIMQSEVNRIIYQGPYFEPERNITERIIKAFGL